MEALVVTLDTSKKLKAAGFPQETYGWWFLDHPKPFVVGRSDKDFQKRYYAAAPTAQEIADQLPNNWEVREHNGQYISFLAGIGEMDFEEQSGDTMAEALASLWLKLQESK